MTVLRNTHLTTLWKMGHDEFRMTLGAHVQLGTEFEIAERFSIRVDVLARLRFAERTFEPKWAPLDKLNPITTGAVAMGVWSIE